MTLSRPFSRVLWLFSIIRSRLRIKKIVSVPDIFKERYTLENYNTVVLYTNTPEQFTNFQETKELIQRKQQPRLNVSLIATVKNERDNVVQWFNNMSSWNRLPDEVVIVDTGSEDDTLKLIREMTSSSPININVISKPGMNIAEGRNIAISKTKHKIIAVTDFGAYPRKDWLERRCNFSFHLWIIPDIYSWNNPTPITKKVIFFIFLVLLLYGIREEESVF